MFTILAIAVAGSNDRGDYCVPSLLPDLLNFLFSHSPQCRYGLSLFRGREIDPVPLIGPEN